MVEFLNATCPSCGRSAREVTLYANGTCSFCGAPPENKADLEIKRNIFVCPNCGSGSSSFESVFSGGVCSRCGKGAGEIGIVGAAEKVRKVGRFGLVVYAGDAATYGQQVEKNLKALDITFLNVNDLFLQDVDIAMREKAIEYFVSRATRVFVVMSPGADKDPYMKQFVKFADYYDAAFPISTPLGGKDADAFRQIRRFEDVVMKDVSSDVKSRFARGVALWFNK